MRAKAEAPEATRDVATLKQSEIASELEEVTAPATTLPASSAQIVPPIAAEVPDTVNREKQSKGEIWAETVKR